MQNTEVSVSTWYKEFIMAGTQKGANKQIGDSNMAEQSM